MRLALLSLVTAGCSFSGPLAVTAGDPGVDAPVGVTPDASVAVVPDAPQGPTFAPCAATDTTGLVACYEFEDDFTTAGKIHDSSANHLDATVHGLTTASRNTSHAAAVMPSDATYVPQTPLLDRAAGFTLALWVNPSSLPSEGNVLGLLDHELQYAMAIGKSSGSVTARCILTGLSFYEWVDGISSNTWSMLACTWDGTNLCAYRWTSATDHTQNCFEPGESPAAVGINGLAIGSLSDTGAPSFPLKGALDSIHVYDHAVPVAGLCTAIGQPAGCLQ